MCLKVYEHCSKSILGTDMELKEKCQHVVPAVSVSHRESFSGEMVGG